MVKSIPPAQGPSLAYTKPQQSAPDFNINVVIIVAVICAVLCALGLLLHCIFQCTYRELREHVEWVTSRRVNSGLRERDMLALPTSVYRALSSTSSSVSSCAICLMDFSDGDKIRVLPECNHGFHVTCIDKWLLSNSSCPTCRHRLEQINSVEC